MPLTVNLDSQIVVQTAAAWAADATIYSAKRILVTSDALYTSTDQRKFKIADGVQTWSNLDYFPDVNAAIAALSSVYQPLDSDLTSWAGVTRASGFDTFTATPSSANLRALLTDETGTGLAYFQGGALGTPSSGTLTNCSGLPIAGVTGYQGYLMNAFHSTTAPADATTYYWGSDFALAATTTANILRIYPPEAGTLKAVFLKTRCTAGSNEAVGISVIKNNTTTTSIGSIDLSATQTNNIFSGLNISFNGTTDYLEMVYDATTWATNPTNLRGYAALYFE